MRKKKRKYMKFPLDTLVHSLHRYFFHVFQSAKMLLRILSELV